MAKLSESDAETLAALPPSEVAREVERRRARTEHGRARRRRPMWTLSIATACVAGIAAFVTVFRDRPAALVDAYEGIKGDEHHSSLRIYRQAKGGPQQVSADSQVKQGDNLQIRYLAAGKRYGVIASIDGRGTVTLHLPELPGQAAVLSRDGERALPHAYELDDSPNFERFVFVTSDAPFSTQQVVRALRAGASFSTPLSSFEVSLRKSP